MLLWQGRRNVSRHQTLQAMLDWSYDLLSEREKEILCVLSAFVGTFTLEMAQAAAFEQGRDGLEVWDVIAGLVDKSLITVSQTEGVSSYRLLEATRAYAAIKLLQREEENELRGVLHFTMQSSFRRSKAIIFLRRDPSACSRRVGDISTVLEWSFSTSGDISGAGVVLTVDTERCPGAGVGGGYLRWMRRIAVQSAGKDLQLSSALSGRRSSAAYPEDAGSLLESPKRAFTRSRMRWNMT